MPAKVLQRIYLLLLHSLQLFLLRFSRLFDLGEFSALLSANIIRDLDKRILFLLFEQIDACLVLLRAQISNRRVIEDSFLVELLHLLLSHLLVASLDIILQST